MKMKAKHARCHIHTIHTLASIVSKLGFMSKNSILHLLNLTRFIRLTASLSFRISYKSMKCAKGCECERERDHMYNKNHLIEFFFMPYAIINIQVTSKVSKMSGLLLLLLLLHNFFCCCCM